MADSPPRTGRSQRADSRLPQLLDAAAAQFAAKGFEAASIRDIVRSVGMLPGSLYYHFANKEELLLAVYAEGVRRIAGAVDDALAGQTDPWLRLERAAAAHLAAVLDRSAYAKVVISVGPHRAPAVAARLVALRDEHERRFVGLIGALPLAPDVDRTLLRLMLLGALNWVPSWYHEGGRPPQQIAASFVQALRAPAAGSG